jgi:hypothetical protein
MDGLPDSARIVFASASMRSLPPRARCVGFGLPGPKSESWSADRQKKTLNGKEPSKEGVCWKEKEREKLIS